MTTNKKPGDRMWYYYNAGFGTYRQVAEMEVSSWDMYIWGCPPYDTKQEFIDSKLWESRVGFMHHEFHDMQYQSFIGVQQIDDLFDKWEINGFRVLKNKSFFSGGWISKSVIDLLNQRCKDRRIETYKINRQDIILVDDIINFCKGRKLVWKDQIANLRNPSLYQ